MQAAVEAYRAEFLEGFTLPDSSGFNEWASLQREHWHLCLGEIFDALSCSLLNSGQTTRAKRIATRWVAFDQFQEIAYRRLIRAQLADGDRNSALSSYQDCREMLSQELGVTPSPTTQALEKQIRSGGLESHSSPPELPSRASPRQLVTPMVGRTKEHKKLVDAFQQASQDRAKVVLIEDEAGIGKTRLGEEFLE